MRGGAVIKYITNMHNCVCLMNGQILHAYPGTLTTAQQQCSDSSAETTTKVFSLKAVKSSNLSNMQPVV